MPIPCERKLLAWAKTTPWHRLVRFIRGEGAKGHSRDVVLSLIDVFESRRWREEGHVRATPPQVTYNDASTSPRDRIWTRHNERMVAKNELESLRDLTPTGFELYVTDMFRKLGFNARQVGGSCDDGIDVIISRDDDSDFAVAQCKRFAAKNRVSAGHIREFVGAYELSEVPLGFFMTTSKFTAHARRTAKRFEWLTLYDGNGILRLLKHGLEGVGTSESALHKEA